MDNDAGRSWGRDGLLVAGRFTNYKGVAFLTELGTSPMTSADAVSRIQYQKWFLSSCTKLRRRDFTAGDTATIFGKQTLPATLPTQDNELKCMQERLGHHDHVTNRCAPTWVGKKMGTARLHAPTCAPWRIWWLWQRPWQLSTILGGWKTQPPSIEKLLALFRALR